MITINNKYPLGEIVYHIADIDSLPRIIIGIEVGIDGSYLYKTVKSDTVIYCYEKELVLNKEEVLI